MTKFEEFQLDEIGVVQLARLAEMLVPAPKATMRQRINSIWGDSLRPRKKFRSKHDSVSMQSHYEKIWSEKSLHKEFGQGKPVCKTSDNRQVIFNDECFYSPVRWLTAAQIICLASHIRQTSPTTVLEVGSGSGMLMIALAAIFPEQQFIGLELTEAGIESATRAMQDKSLVTSICDFVFGEDVLHGIVFPIANLSFNRVDMSQSLPEIKAQFLFSSLAFEQMESVFDSAFSNSLELFTERAMFFEPFLEFNSPLKRRVLKSKKYMYRNFPSEKITDNSKVRFLSMPKNLNKTKFSFGIVTVETP